MRDRVRQFAALLFAACVLGMSPAQAADDPLEYRVKAAFLYNFARFVTWPASRFAAPESPVELCVLGSEGFSAVLEETVTDKTAGSRPLHVKRVEQLRDLQECHVAYIAGEGSAQSERALAQLAGHSVLTVYEGPNTLSDGVVRFYLEDRRVRFEINAAAAEREKLQVSSKLLAVAKVVDQ